MTAFFVYGTLMTGLRNQLKFLPHHMVSKIVPGVVLDTRLVHFAEGYPGMYPEKGGPGVKGEVVYVKPEFVKTVVKSLDYLEQYYGPDDERNLYVHC